MPNFTRDDVWQSEVDQARQHDQTEGTFETPTDPAEQLHHNLYRGTAYIVGSETWEGSKKLLAEINKRARNNFEHEFKSSFGRSLAFFNMASSDIAIGFRNGLKMKAFRKYDVTTGYLIIRERYVFHFHPIQVDINREICCADMYRNSIENPPCRQSAALHEALLREYVTETESQPLRNYKETTFDVHYIISEEALREAPDHQLYLTDLDIVVGLADHPYQLKKHPYLYSETLKTFRKTLEAVENAQRSKPKPALATNFALDEHYSGCDMVLVDHTGQYGDRWLNVGSEVLCVKMTTGTPLRKLDGLYLRVTAQHNTSGTVIEPTRIIPLDVADATMHWFKSRQEAIDYGDPKKRQERALEQLKADYKMLELDHKAAMLEIERKHQSEMDEMKSRSEAESQERKTELENLKIEKERLAFEHEKAIFAMRKETEERAGKNKNREGFFKWIAAAFSFVFSATLMILKKWSTA